MEVNTPGGAACVALLGAGVEVGDLLEELLYLCLCHVPPLHHGLGVGLLGGGERLGELGLQLEAGDCPGDVVQHTEVLNLRVVKCFIFFFVSFVHKVVVHLVHLNHSTAVGTLRNVLCI